MKRTILITAAVAALTLGGACSSDHLDSKGNSGGGNGSAAIAITISTSGSTRAEGDAAGTITGTADENIFGANAYYYVFSDNFLEKSGYIGVSDSKQTDVITGIQATGEKVVYIVNSDHDITLEELNDEVTIEDFGKFLIDAIDNNDVNLLTRNPYLMVGKSKAQTLQPNANFSDVNAMETYAGSNVFDIDVYRASGKAQLLFALEGTPDVALKTIDGDPTGKVYNTYDNVYHGVNAWFTDANFCMVQKARQMCFGAAQPLGEFRGHGTANPQGDSHTDGTYSGYTTLPADFSGLLKGSVRSEGDFSKQEPGNTEYMPENFPAKIKPGTTVKYDGDGAYDGDNDPVTGNVTFVMAEMVVTPKNFTSCTKKADNSYEVVRTVNDIVGKDFYVIAKVDKKNAVFTYLADNANYEIYYFDETVAAGGKIEENANIANIAAYHGITLKSAAEAGVDDWQVLKFTGGKAYYRINITNQEYTGNDLSKKYSVHRNSYYQITVNSIHSLGSPTGQGVIPEDPNTPLEPETSIKCSINVMPWKIRNINANL